MHGPGCLSGQVKHRVEYIPRCFVLGFALSWWQHQSRRPGQGEDQCYGVMTQHLVGGVCFERELVDAFRVNVDEDVGAAVTATIRGMLELDRGAQFEEGFIG